LGAILGAASALGSPNTFHFEISNVISPEQPNATVTLWAAFDPKWLAFHEARTEVSTGLDRGWFSDPLALLDDPEGASKPGEVVQDGDRVSGIYITQLYIPFSHLPATDNPIPVWSATWTTDDFTPRQVDLGTQSESFEVYEDAGAHHDMFGVDFAEGSGMISVVPGPGTGVVLGVGVLWARRRRSGVC
jgi:hypothetical protein